MRYESFQEKSDVSVLYENSLSLLRNFSQISSKQHNDLLLSLRSHRVEDSQTRRQRGMKHAKLETSTRLGVMSGSSHLPPQLERFETLFQVLQASPSLPFFPSQPLHAKQLLLFEPQKLVSTSTLWFNDSRPLPCASPTSLQQPCVSHG